MIAITGATGFIGNHLARALEKQSMPLRLLIRKNSPRKKQLDWSRSEVVETDFEDPKQLAVHLQDCRILIHILGLINGTEEELERANVFYTKTIMEAALQAKVEKVLFFSSVAALRQHGFYGQSKARAEVIVKEAGIPYVMLRPAYIYGKGDLNSTQMLIQTLKRSPMIPVLGGGNFKLQPVYVEDVVKLVLDLLGSDQANQAYTVAGPEQISLKQMLQILSEELKLSRLFIPIPLKPVQVVMRLYLKICPQTKLPAKQILELDKHEAFDISKTTKAFHFCPMNFQAGVKRMFKS